MSIRAQKLNWCLARETRMKKIKPNNEIRGHNPLFHFMYHALLAILFKKGYESRNHECTFNTVEYLIEEGKINLDMKDIAFIRTTEQMTSKDAKSLREEFQYGTETAVNEKLLNELLENAKKVVEKIEISLRE